jgi:hypothetical protein
MRVYFWFFIPVCICYKFTLGILDAFLIILAAFLV